MKARGLIFNDVVAFSCPGNLLMIGINEDKTLSSWRGRFWGTS